MILFFVYLGFYAGFMGLAAFAPAVMGRPAVVGVNLAIVYGMGLIAGALVVAAIYMWLCGRHARQFHAADQHAESRHAEGSQIPDLAGLDTPGAVAQARLPRR